MPASSNFLRTGVHVSAEVDRRHARRASAARGRRRARERFGMVGHQLRLAKADLCHRGDDGAASLMARKL